MPVLLEYLRPLALATVAVGTSKHVFSTGSEALQVGFGELLARNSDELAKMMGRFVHKARVSWGLGFRFARTGGLWIHRVGSRFGASGDLRERRSDSGS